LVLSLHFHSDGGRDRTNRRSDGALLYFFATRFFGQYAATYLVVLGLLTLFMALYSPGGLWSLFLKVRNWPRFPVSHFLILNEA